VLIAIAEALGKSTERIAGLRKTIIFTFFGAESWGFAGSSRFVKDISEPFKCLITEKHANCGSNFGNGCSLPCHQELDFRKINFDRIANIIDFDTVGHLYSNIGASVEYSIHADDPTLLGNMLDGIPASISAPGFNGTSGVEVIFSRAFQEGKNNRLPPSSAMEFLKKKRSIPTVVISDYKTEYSNQYNDLILDLGVRYWILAQ
jgi:Zn-dependent M28 family amino/carboxypeptidase